MKWGGGVVSPDVALLPTATATYPGGSLADYHQRLVATDGSKRSAAPLNMLVEQVLA